MMYKVVYDMGHTIDGVHADSLEEAKTTAFDILSLWLSDAVLFDENPAEVLHDCCVWVEECIDGSEWEEVWCPSDEELRDAGWGFLIDDEMEVSKDAK